MASLLFTEDAYNFALSMCTVSIAITWALAAAYQVKLSVQRHEAGQALIGLIAMVFLVVGPCSAAGSTCSCAAWATSPDCSSSLLVAGRMVRASLVGRTLPWLS